MSRLRVLIADDHHAIRQGVRHALEAAGIEVCAEVTNADDAVREAKETRPDVCLLDIGMPGNGLRAIGEIITALPATRVLMLTVSDSSADLFDALRAGAAGYLLKDIAVARLPLAVEAVHAGEVVLPGGLTSQLVDEFRARGGRTKIVRSDGRAIALTPREWDVLELLAEGLTTAEMAERLFLRPITVRRHISDLVHKLRVTSRSAAIDLLRQRHTSYDPRSDI